MAGSTFGNIFKITTWGESHGKGVGVVVDGCPAGLSLCEEDIQKFLNRRKPGQSKFTTPRKEDDSVEVLSGVFEGKTTGTPISLVVYNKNQQSKDYSEIASYYRPGHADYTFDMKYGFRDYRGGGRSSGRETIGRVAAGAIAVKILDQLGIRLMTYSKSIGSIACDPRHFDAEEILKNPVYCGKIAYGRRRTEKVHGTRNDYRLVEQDDYLLVDGLHEGIVSEELWHEAQVKLLAQAEKYERVNRGKDTKIHLLSGIVKCPVCGVGMYGNKSIKHKADGSKYKDFYYYGCKHRAMTRGHKCDFKKQINEELLDSAVAEVIVKLVSNPKFAAMMQEKISMKVDTSAIEQEIAAHEKQLRQSYSVKARLMDEIDSLDPDDKHYIKRKADLDDRLYKMYDKIEDTENQLVAARAKKMAIEAEKLTGDNIYKVLIFFDKLYSVMDDQEKRQLMESLLSEVQIYEERQPNGQWLKSIKFKLPIIAEDMSLSLDNDAHIERVCLLSKEAGEEQQR